MGLIRLPLSDESLHAPILHISQFALKKILLVISVLVAVLVLPAQINQFIDEIPIMRERWLNATHWTGLYSSFPEGIVNMAELDLTWESDAIVYLEYLEEGHAIDGYLHSDIVCLNQKEPWYRNALLTGSPDIWFPNRLILDVYDIRQGHTVILDTIQIDREAPGGIITLKSLKVDGQILKETLRLAQNPI